MNRILVIEDEPDIQEVLRNYPPPGIRMPVLLAGDGEEGLRFSKSKRWICAAGCDAAESGRFYGVGADTGIYRIPVILLTAPDGVEDQSEGFWTADR